MSKNSVDTASIDALIKAAEIIEERQNKNTCVNNSNANGNINNINGLSGFMEDKKLPGHHIENTEDTTNVQSTDLSPHVYSLESGVQKSIFDRDARKVHNQLEKHRRADLKFRFERLREQVSGSVARRCSSLSILRGAVRNLMMLTQRQQELEMLEKELIAHRDTITKRHQRCYQELKLKGVDPDAVIAASSAVQPQKAAPLENRVASAGNLLEVQSTINGQNELIPTSNPVYSEKHPVSENLLGNNLSNFCRLLNNRKRRRRHSTGDCKKWKDQDNESTTTASECGDPNETGDEATDDASECESTPPCLTLPRLHSALLSDDHSQQSAAPLSTVHLQPRAYLSLSNSVSFPISSYHQPMGTEDPETLNQSDLSVSQRGLPVKKRRLDWMSQRHTAASDDLSILRSLSGVSEPIKNGGGSCNSSFTHSTFSSLSSSGSSINSTRLSASHNDLSSQKSRMSMEGGEASRLNLITNSISQSDLQLTKRCLVKAFTATTQDSGDVSGKTHSAVQLSSSTVNSSGGSYSRVSPSLTTVLTPVSLSSSLDCTGQSGRLGHTGHVVVSADNKLQTVRTGLSNSVRMSVLQRTLTETPPSDLGGSLNLPSRTGPLFSQPPTPRRAGTPGPGPPSFQRTSSIDPAPEGLSPGWIGQRMLPVYHLLKAGEAPTIQITSDASRLSTTSLSTPALIGSFKSQNSTVSPKASLITSSSAVISSLTSLGKQQSNVIGNESTSASGGLTIVPVKHLYHSQNHQMPYINKPNNVSSYQPPSASLVSNSMPSGGIITPRQLQSILQLSVPDTPSSTDSGNIASRLSHQLHSLGRHPSSHPLVIPMSGSSRDPPVLLLPVQLASSASQPHSSSTIITTAAASSNSTMASGNRNSGVIFNEPLDTLLTVAAAATSSASYMHR